MHDELVKLFKRALIEQKLDSFARGHLAGSVLLLDAFGAAAFFSLRGSFFRSISVWTSHCFWLLFRSHRSCCFVERKRTRFDQYSTQIIQRLDARSSVPRQGSRNARVFFEVLEVENPVREVRFDQDVDIEIDVAQNTPIQTRRHVDVAVELFNLRIGSLKRKTLYQRSSQ